jgi:hypothetical protein
MHIHRCTVEIPVLYYYSDLRLDIIHLDIEFFL